MFSFERNTILLVGGQPQYSRIYCLCKHHASFVDQGKCYRISAAHLQVKIFYPYFHTFLGSEQTGSILFSSFVYLHLKVLALCAQIIFLIFKITLRSVLFVTWRCFIFIRGFCILITKNIFSLLTDFIEDNVYAFWLWRSRLLSFFVKCVGLRQLEINWRSPSQFAVEVPHLRSSFIDCSHGQTLIVVSKLLIMLVFRIFYDFSTLRLNWSLLMCMYWLSILHLLSFPHEAKMRPGPCKASESYRAELYNNTV